MTRLRYWRRSAGFLAFWAFGLIVLFLLARAFDFAWPPIATLVFFLCIFAWGLTCGGRE